MERGRLKMKEAFKNSVIATLCWKKQSVRQLIWKQKLLNSGKRFGWHDPG